MVPDATRVTLAVMLCLGSGNLRADEQTRQPRSSALWWQIVKQHGGADAEELAQHSFAREHQFERRGELGMVRRGASSGVANRMAQDRLRGEQRVKLARQIGGKRLGSTIYELDPFGVGTWHRNDSIG